MRKYPKLSLVGQCEVGMSPSVIDYFEAVIQWSMPWSPRTQRSEQRRPFYCCNYFSCAQFGRRGKSGNSRGTIVQWWTVGAWQKMWLKHKVVAQRSLAIGVKSSSAQWVEAVKMAWTLLQSMLLGELGEESGNGKGRKFSIKGRKENSQEDRVKKREKGRKRKRRVERKERRFPRRQGKKEREG